MSAKEAMDATQKQLKDESAALGDVGKFADTVAGSFIPMKAPEWVCSVICANLDMDTLLVDMEVDKLPPNPANLNKTFTELKGVNEEENHVLNTNTEQYHYPKFS